MASTEKAIGSVEGVKEARVNFALGRAAAELRKGSAPDDIERRVITAVEQAGYKASRRGVHGTHGAGATQSAHDHSKDTSAFWSKRCVVGIALSMPIMILEMAGHAGQEGLSQSGHKWLTFALTSAVMAYVGRPFFASASRALRHGQFHMDSLIAWGSGVAYAYSTAVLLMSSLGMFAPGGTLYFESAAMIVTLISIGKWMEAGARAKAGDAIRSLLDLAPKMARVERFGREIEIPVDQVYRGDVLVVRPGEKGRSPPERRWRESLVPDRP